MACIIFTPRRAHKLIELVKLILRFCTLRKYLNGEEKTKSIKIRDLRNRTNLNFVCAIGSISTLDPADGELEYTSLDSRKTIRPLSCSLLLVDLYISYRIIQLADASDHVIFSRARRYNWHISIMASFYIRIGTMIERFPVLLPIFSHSFSLCVCLILLRAAKISYRAKGS